MTDLVQRELELDADPAEAWQALTDPAWLSAWLADEVELDCTPGGEARFTLGEEVREGWVEEVCPPADDSDGDGRDGDGRDGDPDGDRDGDGRGRLTFWWARGDEPASRVELELSPLDGGRTLLRVVETRPLELLDLVGMPLGGTRDGTYGPSLVAA